MTEFKAFAKIARLNREVIVTEKIDGTNAQITIVKRGTGDAADHANITSIVHADDGFEYNVYAGSRSRWVVLGADNHGFAAWVGENAVELVAGLGVGTHHGEWWGRGINRGYDLAEKRFSLFNATRWGKMRPACCHVVPVLASGIGFEGPVEAAIDELQNYGSAAAPGFLNPEGVVAFHTASNTYHKVTLERDEEHKGANA